MFNSNIASEQKYLHNIFLRNFNYIRYLISNNICKLNLPVTQKIIKCIKYDRADYRGFSLLRDFRDEKKLFLSLRPLRATVRKENFVLKIEIIHSTIDLKTKARLFVGLLFV